MKKVLGLIIVLTLCFTAPVMAQYYNGYCVVKGGYFGPAEDYANKDLDGKSYWELGIGYSLGAIGIELSGGYMKTENNLVEVKAIPILLTGRLQFPITIVTPYLEGGVGAYFTDAELNNGKSKDDTAYGYHGGVGVDVHLKRLLLGVEGRYMWVKPEYDFGDVDLKGFTVTANIGFCF